MTETQQFGRPDFIPRDLFRSWVRSSLLNKHMTVDGIQAASYISRCEGTNPLPSKLVYGKKCYRAIDLVARARACCHPVNPPQREMLLQDIASLKNELAFLTKQVTTAKHILSQADPSISLTGKIFLSPEEVIAGQFKPLNDMKSFLNLSAKNDTPPKTGIYFIINQNSIIYIGQTTDLISRLTSHSYNKTFDAFAFIELPNEDLDITESLYIHTIRPELNGWRGGNAAAGIKSAPYSMTQIMDMCRNRENQK